MANPISADDILSQDIFTLLGMENLSDQEKEEMLDAMNDTIQARLFLSLSEELSPEDQTKLNSLQGEELARFFDERGIDLTARLLEETLQYRYELATTFQIVTQPQTPSQPIAA